MFGKYTNGYNSEHERGVGKENCRRNMKKGAHKNTQTIIANKISTTVKI